MSIPILPFLCFSNFNWNHIVCSSFVLFILFFLCFLWMKSEIEFGRLQFLFCLFFSVNQPSFKHPERQLLDSPTLFVSFLDCDSMSLLNQALRRDFNNSHFCTRQRWTPTQSLVIYHQPNCVIACHSRNGSWKPYNSASIKVVWLVLQWETLQTKNKF